MLFLRADESQLRKQSGVRYPMACNAFHATISLDDMFSRLPEE
jgi:hypothetical protein